MEEWEEVGKEIRRNQAIEILASRELQVFILTGRGKTPVEIAAIMGISRRTVGTYRISILRKMQLENIYQVMEYCIHADMDGDEFMDRWLP